MAVFHTIDLDFEEVGQGTPVVLLHGFPLNRSTWYPLIPFLKDKARLIMPDLRGFGRSPAGDEPSTMRLMAEDVAVLVRKLGLKKFIMAGHSMGGYISLAFAQAYPQHLCGLALVASMATDDSPEKRQARFKTIENVKKHGSEVLAKDMPLRLTSDVDLQKKLSEIIGGENPKAIINALKGMADRPDYTDVLPSIQSPTVIVAGQKDVVISKERIDVMVRLLQKNWVVEVPNGGHMPMMEAPETVANAIIDLIKMA
ncbi:MAG: alpha/beta hydrolase [Anaerolineae bacterium]|nr:alpha/beta hydrolase [Anaerolineae bacterium]